jgi:hypothetical protein
MGAKERLAVNPMTARFRLRTKPTHYKMVKCHRIDNTKAGWACHTKVFVPGQHYVRHITEWFQPSVWEYLEHGYVNPQKRTLKKRAAKAAAEAAALAAAEQPAEPERPKQESPKNPPPPIMLDEDEDITEEIPVASVTAHPSSPKKYSDKEEVPGEYNPRAHPEKVMGAPDDLIVFDDLVSQNYIASQRKMKLEQLRHRQRIMGTPGQPIVSGFEPG